MRRRNLIAIVALLVIALVAGGGLLTVGPIGSTKIADFEQTPTYWWPLNSLAGTSAAFSVNVGNNAYFVTQVDVQLNAAKVGTWNTAYVIKCGGVAYSATGGAEGNNVPITLSAGQTTWFTMTPVYTNTVGISSATSQYVDCTLNLAAVSLTGGVADSDLRWGQVQAFGTAGYDLVVWAKTQAPPSSMTADFTFNLPAQDQFTVQFNGAVSGGLSPYSWHWYFTQSVDCSAYKTTTSDSTIQSPSHAFTLPNRVYTYTYPVSLVVTDSSTTFPQCAAQTHKVTITASSPPPPPQLVADFSITGTNGLMASVDASPTTGGTPPYVTYTWSWGDGTNPSYGSLQSHTYGADGTYGISLRVTDSAGATAMSATKTVTVAGSGTKLSASFTATAQGLTATFASSAMGGKTPYKYLWSFGDAATSTQVSPEHAYAKEGSYAVMLAVTDASGNIANYTHDVVVGPNCVGTSCGTGLPIVFSPVAIILLFVGFGLIVGGIIRKGKFLIGIPVGAAFLVLAALVLLGVLVI